MFTFVILDDITGVVIESDSIENAKSTAREHGYTGVIKIWIEEASNYLVVGVV